MSTMSRDSQSKRCATTTENSPGIIEDKSAAIPEEIWEKIFKYTEYSDVFNLKLVSKHFHAIATQVMDIKYKWYVLCQKKVPESQWSGILKHGHHPVNDNINCGNFHAESEYPAIWRFLYSTWLEFSRFIDEEPDVEIFAGHSWGCPEIVRFDGNIIAAYSRGRDICFYDILKLDPRPINQILCPNLCSGLLLSNKGTDLTLVRRTRAENEWIMESWKVPSQQVMNVEIIGPAKSLGIRESFGYLCLIKTYDPPEDTHCDVEIREVASRGTPRSVRIQIEADYEIRQVETHGDTLLLLLISRNEYAKVYKISIRETQLKEICAIPSCEANHMAYYFRWKLKILHPCVAVSINDEKISFSVSGKKWKSYDVKESLGLGSRVMNERSMAYEGGILALVSDTSEDIKMMNVGDPDRLVSQLEAMPSRMITVKREEMGNYFSQCLNLNVGFTEYNSKVYLVVATKERLVVLKSR